MNTWSIGLVTLSLVLLGGTPPTVKTMNSTPDPTGPASAPAAGQTEVATLGGGCFWCLQAIFERVHGVKHITCGYAGGHTVNPTYREVCTETTGHAEVVQIEFDPKEISFRHLLDIFWLAHDPTTLNRQGADIGSQYRSIILYHNETQQKEAEASKAEAQKHFARPIVTQIVPLRKFYPAELYHQEYYRDHPGAPYCQLVIRPKLEKLERELNEK